MLYHSESVVDILRGGNRGEGDHRPRLHADARVRLRLCAGLGIAFALSSTVHAQTTVLPVTTNSEVALEAAVLAANALAFHTSPAQPVVIEFASSLIGQTIPLTHALPPLVVDYVTMRVANAGPTSRVIIDATNAPTAFRITSRYATVQNVRFQNAGIGGVPLDVFTAFGTDHLTLSNCDFDGAGGDGLWLIGATATTIQDCNIRWNDVAGLLATGGTADLDVRRCTFVANHVGVGLGIANQVQIHECTLDGNEYGTVLWPVCADVTFGPSNVVRNGTTMPSLIAIGAVRFSILASQFNDNQHTAIQLCNLCVDVTIDGVTLARNGIPAGEHQMTIGDCTNVQISGLQCVDGGAGIFASTTGQLGITGSATAPTAVTGNDREGIVLNGCTDVAVNQVTVSGNLRVVGGAQLALLGCSRADVVGSSITAAPGPSRFGVRIEGSDNVRVGLGTSILDNGEIGVLVNNSNDVVLGNWPGATGSLTVRGRLPLHVDTCARLRVAGTTAAPCSLLAGTAPTGFAVGISHCSTGVLGPSLIVDGQQTAATAMQVTDSSSVLLDAVTISGHTGWGVVAAGTPGLLIRNCSVDGGTTGASGQGVLLNAGCHGAVLLGNLVRRQQSSAFVIADSNDAFIGPGNRAIDNGGDGFVVSDSGSGAPTRHATIQSSVAVGRNLASQSGFRCIKVLANLTNVTATRNGTGVLLNLGALATIVNTISWGNTVDRNRDGSSSGSWLYGLRATSAGTGTPGSWSEQNMLIGVNPQFVSAATGDVRLASGSPAIDSGLHATPIGAGLPSADAALLPRIRGGVIDRGACEFTPAAGTGNSLELAGSWLRTSAQSQLAFGVQGTGAQAGQPFLLLLGGSGTGPGFSAPGGTIAPLVPDVFTSLLLQVPAWCLGALNGAASGAATVPLPAYIVPLLPELTFVAVMTSGPPTNPVVVRFVP